MNEMIKQCSMHDFSIDNMVVRVPRRAPCPCCLRLVAGSSALQSLRLAATESSSSSPQGGRSSRGGCLLRGASQSASCLLSRRKRSAPARDQLRVELLAQLLDHRVACTRHGKVGRLLQVGCEVVELNAVDLGKVGFKALEVVADPFGIAYVGAIGCGGASFATVW